MKWFNFFRKQKKEAGVWRSTNNQRLVEYKSLIEVPSMTCIPEGELGLEIYLVKSGDNPKWVVFDCPGGHKKRLSVNLMRSKYPNWDTFITKGKISLSPSVSANDEKCKCHFWLKNSIAYKAFFEYE